MDIILSIMDKIYGNSDNLTKIYIIGAAVLFFFLVLLIFSLRKPKNEKIIEDPTDKEKKKDEEIKEIKKEEIKEEPIKEIEPEEKEVKIVNTDIKIK